MRNQLSLDDMFEPFKHFSKVQKAAIATSVYTQMDITEVVNLKWSDELILNWRAEFILNKLQPSSSTNYIFWERNSDIDERLCSLPLLVSASTGWASWTSFINKYYKAIPIEFNHAYLPV